MVALITGVPMSTFTFLKTNCPELCETAREAEQNPKSKGDPHHPENRQLAIRKKTCFLLICIIFYELTDLVQIY